jgi:hypothetical protein
VQAITYEVAVKSVEESGAISDEWFEGRANTEVDQLLNWHLACGLLQVVRRLAIWHLVWDTGWMLDAKGRRVICA